MACIVLHQSVFTHRKTMHVAKLLELPEIYVVAHLASLWTWALVNAKSGFLPECDYTIAKAAQWTGDPQTFVDALIDANFINDEHRDLKLYNYEFYADILAIVNTTEMLEGF